MLATHIPLTEIRAMSQRDYESLKLYLAVKGAKESGSSISFEDDGTMTICPDPSSVRKDGMGQPAT